MPTLLHLDSSAAAERSRSRAITATFAETWRSLGPGHTVVYRDLHSTPPPHLPDAALHWPARLRPPREVSGGEPGREPHGPSGREPGGPTAALVAAEALQADLIDELTAADVLLIGAPLYNYSVPSPLKAWLDYVHVPGVTAPFDVATQPLAGRPAVIVASRGASYDAGSATDGWDHAVPVLQLILGSALGMQVEVIATNLTLADTVPALAGQLERSRAELAEAHRAADSAARRLG